MTGQSATARFPKLSANQVRVLTEAEIEAVFGGDGYGGSGGGGGEIVVTAPSGGGTGTGSTGGTGTGGGSYGGTGSIGGSSTSGQPHATANASQAANQFADKHVHNNGTTQLDRDTAQNMHDVLAHEYDKLTANPNGVVAIIPGDGIYPDKIIHASDVLAALDKGAWNVTDSTAYNTVGPNGASTSLTTGVTNINPQLLQRSSGSSMITTADGIMGIVDHELAHRVIEQSVPQQSVYQVGTSANESDASLMRSYIELYLNPPKL